MTKKKKSNSNNIGYYIIAVIIGVLCLLFTYFIVNKVMLSDKKLWSISLVALYLGVIAESYRITRNWKQVVLQFLGTYLLSFLAFLPGKKEKVYDFEKHIEFWPYFFLICFLIISIVRYKEKVTAKLTEGITLMLTISFIYWIYDSGILNFNRWYHLPVSVVVLGFSTLSFVNAFSEIKLTKTNRLWLSVWTTIVSVVIAVDNIINIYRNGDIEAHRLFSEQVLIGLQYFLLGISSVYIAQNINLILSFLPKRSEKYKKTLKETVNDHLKRYSDFQVRKIDSIFCVLFTTMIYYLNYQYNLLPKNMMIWLVISIFPLILNVFNRLIKN